MNTHTSICDFNYRDFLLVKAPKEDVLAAVNAVALENEAMMQGFEGDAGPWKPGLGMRLIMWLFRKNDAVKAVKQMAHDWENQDFEPVEQGAHDASRRRGGLGHWSNDHQGGTLSDARDGDDLSDG